MLWYWSSYRWYKIFYRLYIKNSTYTFDFPLRDIGEESRSNLVHKFVATLGHKSSRIMVDRDFKLIGAKVAECLEDLDLYKTILYKIQVLGTPTRTKNQNSLAEIRGK